MEMQDLYKMLEAYGIRGAIFGIIFFIIGTIIKSRWWSKTTDKIIQFFMKKKVKEIPHGEISESDIINHDIFNYIDFWTYSKIPTF